MIILGELTFTIGFANIVASFNDKELSGSPITLITGSQTAGDVVDFSAALLSGRALQCIPNIAVRTLSRASTAVTVVNAGKSLRESGREIHEALRPNAPQLFTPGNFDPLTPGFFTVRGLDTPELGP